MPDDTSDHPHWFSRAGERAINALLTATIIGAGVFIIDYVTTDPEHALTQQRVQEHEERLDQGDTTIALLTQSVATQTMSVTALAFDRAVLALKEGTKTMLELERVHGRLPLDRWPEADRQLYITSKAQIENAEMRIGMDPVAPVPAPSTPP